MVEHFYKSVLLPGTPPLNFLRLLVLDGNSCADPISALCAVTLPDGYTNVLRSYALCFSAEKSK